jgi:D-glycero-D-manno-heptose 1,7-bisphosphate phosphatase
VPLETALYPRLAREKRLAAFRTGHRYYGTGSLERIRQAEAFFARRPALLVERDGVLNQPPPEPGRPLLDPDQWRWMPGALEALRRIREAGWRTIVVTNQTGAAESPGQLRAVHDRMRDEAERAGGSIEAVYCCAHGPEQACECRLPVPGMLWKAQRDHSLDLTETWFVGARGRDQEAAKRAGCLFARVRPGESLLDHAMRILAPAFSSPEVTACAAVS